MKTRRSAEFQQVLSEESSNLGESNVGFRSRRAWKPGCLRRLYAAIGAWPTKANTHQEFVWIEATGNGDIKHRPIILIRRQSTAVKAIVSDAEQDSEYQMVGTW